MLHYQQPFFFFFQLFCYNSALDELKQVHFPVFGEFIPLKDFKIKKREFLELDDLDGEFISAVNFGSEKVISNVFQNPHNVPDFQLLLFFRCSLYLLFSYYSKDLNKLKVSIQVHCFFAILHHFFTGTYYNKINSY